MFQTPFLIFKDFSICMLILKIYGCRPYGYWLGLLEVITLDFEIAVRYGMRNFEVSSEVNFPIN